MCKVGKVGGAGSLRGRSSEDVPAQVGQQVKRLLRPAHVMHLGATEARRLQGGWEGVRTEQRVLVGAGGWLDNIVVGSWLVHNLGMKLDCSQDLLSFRPGSDRGLAIGQ